METSGSSAAHQAGSTTGSLYDCVIIKNATLAPGPRKCIVMGTRLEHAGAAAIMVLYCGDRLFTGAR